MCHISRVTFHMSHVKSHMSHVTGFNYCCALINNLVPLRDFYSYSFVTDSMCWSHIVRVFHTIFICQSVSLTKTLFDHSWPDFYLFISDFNQDLSVIFPFIRDFNPKNP